MEYSPPAKKSNIDSLPRNCREQSNRPSAQLTRHDCEGSLIAENEDQLTILPDDCIINIFTFLNQETLDALLTVSQKINIIALQMRSKVPRSCIFDNLIIRQDDENHFKMSLHGNCPESLDLHLTETGVFETPMDWAKRRRLCEEKSHGKKKILKAPIPHRLMKRIEYLLHRFEIQNIHFCGILIDDSFVLYCQQLPRFPNRIKFSNEATGNMFDKNKFFNWLTSSGIRYIDLNESSLKQSINSQTILDLNHVTNPSLFAGFYKQTQQEEIVSIMDRHILDAVVKFKFFQLPYFQFNADWIVNAIIERLRQDTNGGWCFLVSRQLQQEDFRDLELDLECTHRDGENHIIHIKGRKLRAHIKCTNIGLNVTFSGH